MKHLFTSLKGIALGIAFVIPGFSGGTMAVILKIYDRLLDAISLNLKKIKKNIGFLLMLALGMVIGVLGASFGLSFLFEEYPVPTKIFLIGIIIGSMPMIWHECTKEEKLKPVNIIPFVVTMGIMVGMYFLYGAELTTSAQRDFSIVLAVKLILGGAVAAISMVIPGISGSLMMTVMGLYETLITAIKELNLPLLIPAGIGIVVGLLGGAKIISVLLKKFRQPTYTAIMGLVLGSIFTIFPQEFSLNFQGIISIPIFAVGVAIPLLFDRKKS